MRKIGILGGTFDPIHNGHLHIAKEMRAYKALEQIWFCPARINPEKLYHESTDAPHRLAMLKLALEGNPHFRVIENELRREGPSYMVDTLKELLIEHPNCQFTLIVGEDASVNFYAWKDPHIILTLADLAIVSRGGQALQIPDPLKGCVYPIPHLNISSTDIRHRIANDLPCDPLLPPPVLDYIMEHNLYQP